MKNIENIINRKWRITMRKNSKVNRNTKSKKEDGAFRSKNIKHDPQAESARTKFGQEF
jgi:hypothetical protein